MYIRMLSNNFYFCVYYIFDLIINDLVIYIYIYGIYIAMVDVN